MNHALNVSQLKVGSGLGVKMMVNQKGSLPVMVVELNFNLSLFVFLISILHILLNQVGLTVVPIVFE